MHENVYEQVVDSSHCYVESMAPVQNDPFRAVVSIGSKLSLLYIVEFVSFAFHVSICIMKLKLSRDLRPGAKMFIDLRLALSTGDSCPYLKMNQRIREVARCSGVGDIV